MMVSLHSRETGIVLPKNQRQHSTSRGLAIMIRT